MKAPTAAVSSGRTRRCVFSRSLPSGLILSGIAGACVLAWFSRVATPIERPILLAAAALVLLVPSRGQTPALLRKVVGIYLIAVPFNEIYSQYAVLPFGAGGLAISYSVGPFLLCGLGCLWLRFRQRHAEESPGWSPLLTAWLLALGLVVAHMIVLAILFHATYGYGYEDDFPVLAHLSLCFLLFLLLWRSLDRRALRLSAGLFLTAFYLLLAWKR